MPIRVMLYTGASVPGGLLRHVELLAGGLVAASHTVHVVLSPDAGADTTARTCQSAGAVVTRLTVRGKGDLAGAARLRNLVARERPEVFHAHLSSPIEAVPALLAARWGGAQRVVTTEHAPTWFPRERSYSRAVKRATLRFIDKVIALSRSDAAFLESRFGVPRARLAVVPNGVPAVYGRLSKPQARDQLGVSQAAWPAVAYAGGLEVKKGLLDLVEAARSAAADGLPDLALVLAGQGALLEELRSVARQRPFPLILTGWLPDIEPLLAAADLFVLPSHQEAMPLSVIEAMHRGLPIVATKVGGIPEAIQDGVTGLLVPPGDPAALAAAMVRLALDESLRAGLGRAALQVARDRFDAGHMVRRIEGLYTGLNAGAAVGRM